MSKSSKKIMCDVNQHVKLHAIISIIDPQCIVTHRIIYKLMPFFGYETDDSSLFLLKIIQKMKTYVKQSWHDAVGIDIIMCAVKSTELGQSSDVYCPVTKLNAHGVYMCMNFEKTIKEYLGPVHLKGYAYSKNTLHRMFKLLC